MPSLRSPNQTWKPPFFIESLHQLILQWDSMELQTNTKDYYSKNLEQDMKISLVTFCFHKLYSLIVFEITIIISGSHSRRKNGNLKFLLPSIVQLSSLLQLLPSRPYLLDFRQTSPWKTPHLHPSAQKKRKKERKRRKGKVLMSS